MLHDYFGYDNSGFISELEEMGFVVTDCSLSNYNLTRLSLGSELNLDYIENFFPLEAKSNYISKLNNLLTNNLVFRSLKNAGYISYSFHNEIYPFLNWKNIDNNFHSNRENILTKKLSPFEELFINSTYLKPLTQHFPEILQIFNKGKKDKFNIKPIQDNYILDSLP